MDGRDVHDFQTEPETRAIHDGPALCLTAHQMQNAMAPLDTRGARQKEPGSLNDCMEQSPFKPPLC